jgi:hypothetical protein
MVSKAADHPELAKAERDVVAAEAAVAAAQKVVGDLERKRADAIKHGTELADERANVALAAHTGDEKAAKRLCEIHEAIAIHGSELASLDAALKAAFAKREQAQAAVAVEVQRVNAVKLKILSAAFVSHLKGLDTVLDDLVNSLDAVEQIRSQLQALGVGPREEQFIVMGERPLLAAIADTVFEGRDLGRRLTPNERTSFAALAEAWTRSHHVAIARILGEQTPQEAA